MDNNGDGNNQNFSGGLADLVSTLKGNAQTLALIAKSFVNVMPPATASTSPNVLAFNAISTTPVQIISSSTVRHGLIFHVPQTAALFIYPINIQVTPTATALGGCFTIFGGGTLQFSPLNFPNVNCGWGAFGQAAAQQLTVVEFF